VRPIWSVSTRFPLRGLSLAREPGAVLVWDVQHGLTRYDRGGDLQTQCAAPGPIAAACSADDGASAAVGGDKGQVWRLGPDLLPRWERAVPRRVTAVAQEALGQRLAVADAAGGIHVYDDRGRPVWQATSPRPLALLTFVPEQAVLVGSADHGLVIAFDARGACLWRDGLVAHVGSLAVTGDGTKVALSCFTEGVLCYTPGRPKPRRLPKAGPCRLAALSYNGDVLLTAGLDNRLTLADGEGAVRAELALDAQPVGLAVDALGDGGAAALADGRILRLGF
jgi:hypothetical protein